MPRGPELESLIGQAYDCVLDPEGWGALLDACARFAGGDTAVVYVKPRASAAGSLLTSRDFDLSYNVSRYLSYYEQRSPLIEFYARQPEGGARALGDYAFSAAYRETEFFQDWIRPQGFADMLGSHLVRGPQLSPLKKHIEQVTWARSVPPPHRNGDLHDGCSAVFGADPTYGPWKRYRIGALRSRRRC